MRGPGRLVVRFSQPGGYRPMGYYGRQRQRSSQRVAINSPDTSRASAVEDPPQSPPVALVDSPAIAESHPTWFQVHRIEVRNGDRRAVLIGEFRTERPAYLFAATQASQTRVRKWGSREVPFYSARPPRVI